MLEIKNVKDFDLEQTFMCGQCFRWKQSDDGSYTGVAGGHYAKITKQNDSVYILSDCEDTDFWERYLGLDEDYDKIKASLKGDSVLSNCMEYGYGIRIMKQELWETIVSFIISANNNISRISKIIDRLCESFGEQKSFEGITYYTMPDADTLAGLTLEDLAVIRAGFRDKYILDAALKVSSGEIDLNKLVLMDDTEAKKELMKIKGIGNKVADCILLFSMSRYKTFPKDVWIKRILTEVYRVNEKEIDEFAMQQFGDFAGIAQQYLFYYYRENDINA